MKRTDFEGLGDVPPVERLKDEEDGMRGRRSLARAKSSVRAGLLGWVIDVVDVDGKPRNWDVKSAYWVRRRWIWSWRSLEVLKVFCKYDTSYGILCVGCLRGITACKLSLLLF